MEVDTEMQVEPHLQTPELSQEQASEPTSEVQLSDDINVNVIRDNAIYLSGVDDLHTNDIEKYLVKTYNKPFQIEWINDSSLNIVYDDPEDAFQSLVSMTAPSEFDTAEPTEPIAASQLRLCKVYSEKPEAVIKARFSFESDKKSQGSRAKSRYYLFHGEPTRKEDLVRFGTKRTENPMKYGTKGRELMDSRNRSNRGGDLFPEKAPSIALEEVDDLFPSLAKSQRKRGGRRNRSNKNKNLPDLFEGKIGKSSGDSGPKKAVQTSVYQNMDY